MTTRLKSRRKADAPQTLDHGSLRFRIYTQQRNGQSGTLYRFHTLAYRLNGKRRRIVRADMADIKREIETAATAIANGQTELLDFRQSDRACLQRLREIAAGCDVPLELLVSEAIEARRREASRAKIVNKLCPQIVEELLEVKRAEDAGLRWIEDLESRLNRFAKFCPASLHHLKSDDILAWLRSLNLSKRSFNNNRTALLAFFAFAKERRYLPADWDELAAVKPHKIKKGIEELYTPEELRALLFTAEKHYPQHLPTIAIMGQAGCRHSEMRDAQHALDWARVHFADDTKGQIGTIHVDEIVAKSNTGRRYIPMQPALAAWLEPYARTRGPVCVAKNLTNALARVAEKAGVEWKQNALRNSFISYRCAVTKNVAQVAAEAGNSVGEIHKSYRREIPESEALRWFGIMPTKSDILPLFAHAART